MLWDERRSGHRTAASRGNSLFRKLRSPAADLSARIAPAKRVLQPAKKALLLRIFLHHGKGREEHAGNNCVHAVCRTTSSRTKRRMLFSTACIRASTSRSTEDVLAFHEAFADIVALFQHFSYPGVLRDQIARTRGDLARQSVLGPTRAAVCAGVGTWRRPAQLSRQDRERQMGRHQAGSDTYSRRTPEPHDRGAILVAAVFGAFAKVYRARTRDLFRIATEGTGVLREGDIHPDLVNRLAEEAARAADRALQMCIRAIDYCPPVGITFGAYLRAIVTADYDMNPMDRQNWRLAFIESFREWGISPRATRSMAEDSLLWPTEQDVIKEQVKYEQTQVKYEQKQASYKPGSFGSDVNSATQRGRYAMTKLFSQSAPRSG